MSTKTDDRAVRMQCIQLANTLAVACKVDRSESVVTIARSYFRFVTEGDEGVAIITLPDGMTAAEANNIIEQFGRPRRLSEVA